MKSMPGEVSVKCAKATQGDGRTVGEQKVSQCGAGGDGIRM